MTAISFWTGELLFAGIWLLLRIAVWLRQRGIDRKREALMTLMYINLAVILRFAFFPMSLVDGKVQPLLFDPAAAFPFRVNWIPFARLLDYGSRRDLLLNTVGNAAMFIPSGILLPIVFKKADTFPKVIGAGALLSLCIEILQLPFSVRASDIDDLILNTLGAAVGYGIFALARKIRKNTERPKNDTVS